MKVNISKSWVMAPAVLFFVGCVTPADDWKPAGYYTTDQSVYGCDSFVGTKGTVMKKTAVLSLGLQRRLLELLDHRASADNGLTEELDKSREQQMCWYETPEKEIQLSLGALCDSPFEITFLPRGEEWVVSSALRAVVMCHSIPR
jgi:hypothetical protein